MQKDWSFVSFPLARGFVRAMLSIGPAFGMAAALNGWLPATTSGDIVLQTGDEKKGEGAEGEAREEGQPVQPLEQHKRAEEIRRLRDSARKTSAAGRPNDAQVQLGPDGQPIQPNAMQVPPGQPVQPTEVRPAPRRSSGARSAVPGMEGHEGGPAGVDGGPSVEINIPAALPTPDVILPQDRRYKFAIKDGTYEMLLEAVARQTGLGILGDAPKDGKVSFVTDEELTFAEMLSKVRMLLFNYKQLEPYWLLFDGDHFEVKRVADVYRVLPEDRMFKSVDDFRAANLSGDELALVIFTPKGALSDLREVRNHLPDYVRVSPVEGRNSVAIFALVKDIEKYLRLVDFFAGEKTDIRVMKIFKVNYGSPADIVSKLQTLLDFDRPRAMSPGTVRSGRGGMPEPNPLESLPEPETDIIPEESLKRIIVYAMEDRVRQIEELLPILDVAPESAAGEPVVIDVKNVDCTDLTNTIQQILTANPAAGAPVGGAPLPARRGARKPVGQPTAVASPSLVRAEEITLLPWPSRNAIIVLAGEDGVSRVRRLVEMFDAKGEIGPLRIALKHADASTVAADVSAVMFGEAIPNQPAPLHLVADRSGTVLWFSGSEKQYSEVMELVAVLDVPEPEVKLHSMVLQYQKPSFVVTVLQKLESGDPTIPGVQPAPAAKGRSRRTTRTSDPSKFTPDDEARRLYIVCTDDEWARYKKLAEQLELAASDKSALFEILPLRFLSADLAIERLNVLFQSDTMSSVRLVSTEGGLLVMNAPPRLLSEMKSVLAAIDSPVELIEKTFEIKHVEAAEMQSLLETVLGEDGAAAPQTPTPRSRRRPARTGGAVQPDDNMAVVVPPTPIPTFGGPLTIGRVGNRLLVRTTPPMMDRVAELISQFDVETATTQLRVFGDFPAGADIDGIATTLSTVFGGASPAAAVRGRRAAAGTSEGPQFIPQAGAGKLVVIADGTLLPKIEELVGVLRAAAGKEAEPIMVRFFQLQHADPIELADILEPVLGMKVRRFLITGELSGAQPEAPPVVGGRGRRAAAGSSQNDRYHIEPDPRNKRIVIAAPKVIIEEAAALIEQFDQPGLVPDHAVVRTVMLKNAGAAEMVKAVQDLVGTGSVGRRSARAGRAAAPAAMPEESMTPLTIAELPGGKGVVIRGMPDEVEQTVRHIEDIDNQSIAGRVVKVYRIEHTDIRKLADLILVAVDVPDKPPAGGRKPGGKGGGTGEEEEDRSFRLVNTREGQDVYVQTDLLSKSMIVATTQTKMAQVDKLVEQFNRPPDEDDGPGLSDTKPVPKFTYDLKYKSAFDARFDLELLLETLWEPKNELPKVDDSPIGEFLVIRYPYEDRFEEIRNYIRDYVDKPKDEDIETVTKVLVPPSGISPKEAADWLKKHMPGVDIEIVMPEVAEPEEDYGIEEVPPPKVNKQTNRKPAGDKVGCALPIQRALMTAVGPALGLQPEDEEQEPDPVFEGLPVDPMISGMALQALEPRSGKKKDESSDKKSDDSSKKSSKAPSGPVKIVVDPNRGVMVIETTKSTLEDMKDKLDEMKDELEEMPEKPDVRIIRVRHIDVFTARDILSDIFNSTRQQQAALQQQALIQQQMAMRAAQIQAAGRGQQQPQGRGQPGDGQDGQPGRGAQPQPQPQPQIQMPLPPAQVTIVPNPRDRTLIIKASTSQYPEIKKLLATIDQPKPVDSEMRVFVLEKLNATEVEEILREFLGIDQSASPSAGSRRAGAGAAAAMGMGTTTSVPNLPTLPRPVMAATNTGTLPLTVDPKDIKLTSNADTNSILVMGPKEAIEFVGDLIRELEAQDIPERLTRHYALVHAGVDEVAEYLKDQFADARSAVRGGRSRRSGGADSAPAGSSAGSTGNAPTFLAYSRLNLLTVQATQSQLDEIDAMVERLDVPSSEDDWKSIALSHADAKVVAETLTSMFGGGGGQRNRGGAGSTPGAGSSGGSARFLGDEGGRIVFYSAPQALEERIHVAVEKLEAQSRETGFVRTIALAHAMPSDVAEAIDAAYGQRRSGGGGAARSGRTGGGSTGASGARFTVTASDATKKLFVVSDDDMFAKIESLAMTLDVPKTMDVQFKIYPMKFASAKAIHATMSKMVGDYIRMMPNKGAMEPFSVEVDEKANALVVLGGPTVFRFVEESLSRVDSPANAASPPGYLMMVLKNADATEVAQNITKIWGQKPTTAGEQPPQVEANRTTNVIFVRGTQTQIDEIKKEFIDPLEAQTIASLKSETIKLEHAQAEVVAESIKRIFDEKRLAVQAAGPGRAIPPLETAVAVTPEVNTNQIIIQASESNLAMIKARVAELDKPEVAGQAVTTTKTYAIKFADPTNVANMIREWSKTRTVPTPSGKTAPRDQVVALAEPVTQSLVVTASEANHRLIEQILKDVDTDRAVGGEVRVVPILYGDATEMVTAIQEMLRKPGGAGGRGSALTGDVRVSTLAQSNAIVISGDREEIEQLERTIQSLDTSGEKASVPQIIPLKHARVSQILPTIQELFEGTAGGGARRNQPPPTITADDVENQLVVRGSPTDVTAIRGLVAQLDTEAAAARKPFRIVSVKPGLNLRDLATDIETLVNESAKAQSGTGGRKSAPSVTITPNTRTSTLMLAGNPMLFDQVEEMVRDLEGRGPSGSTTIRVLDLPHITPEEINALMSQLTEQGQGSSGGARPGTTARPSTTTRPRGTRP